MTYAYLFRIGSFDASFISQDALATLQNAKKVLGKACP
jgi:hypothetical protein